MKFRIFLLFFYICGTIGIAHASCTIPDFDAEDYEQYINTNVVDSGSWTYGSVFSCQFYSCATYSYRSGNQLTIVENLTQNCDCSGGPGGWMNGRQRTWTYYNPSDPNGDCFTPAVNLCDNGVLDTGETGIDCGGTCSGSCATYCPPGYGVEVDVDGVEFCALSAPPDKHGNCPSGYSLQTRQSGESVCIHWDSDKNNTTLPDGTGYIAPTLAADGTTVTGQEPTGTTTPDPAWTGYSASVVEQTTPETIVNNSDGTSTGTTTHTKTETTSAGTTTTTTTKTTHYGGSNGSGGVTGETVATTTSSTDPTTETGNYTDVSPDDSGGLSETDYGEPPDWEDLKQNIDAPISEFEDALTGSSIETEDVQCRIDVGNFFGKSISFNFCPYEDKFEILGSFLVTFTYVLGMIFLVERG